MPDPTTIAEMRRQWDAFRETLEWRMGDQAMPEEEMLLAVDIAIREVTLEKEILKECPTGRAP